MKSIVKKAVSNSFTYQEYRSYITSLAQENKTTGHEQREDLVHYTQLNEARLHRLDKTLQVTDETKSFLENLKKEYTWLVISESWCGDAAQILPVINKMATVSDKINLRIVLNCFKNSSDNKSSFFIKCVNIKIK